VFKRAVIVAAAVILAMSGLYKAGARLVSNVAIVSV